MPRLMGENSLFAGKFANNCFNRSNG